MKGDGQQYFPMCSWLFEYMKEREKNHCKDSISKAQRGLLKRDKILSCSSTSKRHDQCEGSRICLPRPRACPGEILTPGTHKTDLAHWAVQALIRRGNGLTNVLIIVYESHLLSKPTVFSVGEKPQCPGSRCAQILILSRLWFLL
jgi:hypothetical protein